MIPGSGTVPNVGLVTDAGGLGMYVVSPRMSKFLLSLRGPSVPAYASLNSQWVFQIPLCQQDSWVGLHLVVSMSIQYGYVDQVDSQTASVSLGGDWGS